MTSETERLRDFWRFVCERHEIFIRRHLGKQPPPWTTDPVLQRGRYTHIYRELDRVTRWLRLSLVEGSVLPAPDLAFNILVYRRFCIPAVFTALGGPCALAQWSWPQAAQALLDREQRGEQNFTGAFMLTNAHDRRPKRLVVVDHLRKTAARWPETWARVLAAGSLADATRALAEPPGMGPFMAYEVVIDLCQAGLLPHSLDSWVYVGPGARRGLRQICGRTLTQKQGLLAIAMLRDRQNEQMIDAGVRLRGPRLTLENVEQALCEYQKYCRLRSGGRGKRLYRAVNDTEMYLWDGLATFQEAAR